VKVITARIVRVELDDAEFPAIIVALSNVLVAMQKLPDEDQKFLVDNNYIEPLLKLKTELQHAPR
jgi:hypothetical protein